VRWGGFRMPQPQKPPKSLTCSLTFSRGIFPVLFVGFAFFAAGLVVSSKDHRAVTS
jgi:hypothetical protein